MFDFLKSKKTVETKPSDNTKLFLEDNAYVVIPLHATCDYIETQKTDESQYDVHYMVVRGKPVLKAVIEGIKWFACDRFITATSDEATIQFILNPTVKNIMDFTRIEVDKDVVYYKVISKDTDIEDIDIDGLMHLFVFNDKKYEFHKKLERYKLLVNDTNEYEKLKKEAFTLEKKLIKIRTQMNIAAELSMYKYFSGVTDPEEVIKQIEDLERKQNQMIVSYKLGDSIVSDANYIQP